ncbi:hypothetical protein HanPI659440_Chr01g0006301 [Helianthus annuus]|nr:hypothetical protein HanPI659440_Chr01g0006301 [Helianthus annuus]
MAFHTYTFITTSTSEGVNAMSNKQKQTVQNMGFGSILKIKTDSIPGRLAHFVVDHFNQRDMVIKLSVGNIEVNENVVSGLLGLRNGGVVLNYQRKESKKGRIKDKTKKSEKNEETKKHDDEEQVNVVKGTKKVKKKKGKTRKKKEVKGEEDLKGKAIDINEEEGDDKDESRGTYAMWTHLYEGCPMTPSRIVERIVCNQDDDGVFFKYDFLALFMNTMVETKKDGTCRTDFLECLNENIALENVNWCKFICDTIKNNKDGWQRDSKSIYFNGALTIMVLIYVDQTLCGHINSVRTTSPLSFWTKDMLSIREKYEIKNGGFGKGLLREGYMEDILSGSVSLKGDGSGAHVTDVKGVGVDVHVKDVDRGVDDEGSVKSDDNGKIQPESFEEHIGLIKQLMDETLRTKASLDKKLDEACLKYPNNENVMKLVRQYDKAFSGEHKMSKLITVTGTTDSSKKDKEYTMTGHVEGVKGSMEGAGKLAETLTDADRGVVDEQGEGKPHDEKEVDFSIPSFMLLPQSSQSSPSLEAEPSVHGNAIEMNEPLNDDEKLIWQYLLTVMDDKRW